MDTSPLIPVPSPESIMSTLFPNGVTAPLSLNQIWSAQILLTPFGGGNGNATVNPSDQLAVAQLTYEQTNSGQLMRISMYLVESLIYFDFLFSSTTAGNEWWWLVSDPQNPQALPSAAFGPYAMSAEVPPCNLLAENGFSHVGSWRIHGETCTAFSAHREAPAGTWYCFDEQSNQISRIMNVDSVNDFAVPILGAYYLVDFPAVQVAASSNLRQVLALCPSGAIQPGPSPMRTLNDIEQAMAESPAGPQISCTPQQLQAVIPGLSMPTTPPSPPAWTDKVSSTCYMIGQDLYPYFCQVWYDWTAGMQVTVLVSQDSNNAYTQRQDMFLPKGVVGPVAIYEWAGTAWTPSCCQAGGGTVPMPVPDFVQADSGKCRATITNNPYFGSISIWSVRMGDPSQWTDFWYWFNAQQQGVVFSMAPAGSLTMIDYQTFVQNGTIPASYLQDPCSQVPACPQSPSAAQAKGQFTPGSRNDRIR